MLVPPGPVYLLKLLPFFLIPSALAYYAFLTANKTFWGGSLPHWLIISVSTLARPLLFVFQRYLNRYLEHRAAAANGAFVIPHVEEKLPNFAGFSLVKTLVADIHKSHPGTAFQEWRKQYGSTYQLRLPTDNRVITDDPDHVKAILATQFDAFHKGPVTYDMFRSLLGTGVFNSDGDMWKFHRNMTRPFFTRDRISDFEIFDRHASHALKLAKDRLAEGQPIDFQDLVSRFTLDSATEFLFGYQVDSLSAGLPYSPRSGIPNSSEFLNHSSNVFVDAFLAGQVQIAVRARRGPIWPLMEFWKDEVKPSREIVDGYTTPVMLRALEERESNDREKVAETGSDQTLLSHLVQHTQDKEVLKDELLNLLVAGRDTTGCTLTYAFYMLCEHPDIAARLRQEILEHVGPTDRPTYENLRDLKYLRAFINEVLRLYPPVPFDGRTARKSTVLHSKFPGSKPYYVPAGTRVLYSIMHIHRREDLWGPTALEFDPDRFLDERLHKYLTPNPYIFTPFNAGPRICLGQQFAYQESSFFLVRLLQQFTNFRLAPEAQPEDSIPPKEWALQGGLIAKEKVRSATHLTLYAKGGVWGRMDEVSN
ncbi:cytochrome P450 monooxygenase pc-1 [Agrocybe pediades]|nr:cytochrome P450 monooxygenase pc-1 [Agrocybe pediades]